MTDETQTSPIGKFYTTNEVADIFKVTAETVRRWIDDGDLKAAAFNGRWRIREQDLVAFSDKKFKEL